MTQEALEKHFLHREARKVNNDATIQLNSKLFEVPQKYIGPKINVRFSRSILDKAYIFNNDNAITDTVYPLKKIDNSKIKRNRFDYTKLTEGNSNV